MAFNLQRSYKYMKMYATKQPSLRINQADLKCRAGCGYYGTAEWDGKFCLNKTTKFLLINNLSLLTPVCRNYQLQVYCTNISYLKHFIIVWQAIAQYATEMLVKRKGEGGATRARILVQKIKLRVFRNLKKRKNSRRTKRTSTALKISHQFLENLPVPKVHSLLLLVFFQL